MRKDMAKVIVERPRSGRSWAGRRAGRTRALVDDDGEPIRARGAREPKGKERREKSLNETLNPLKRYLASNVGRPWNKVFSEISEHLKPSSTVQQHVRDHLKDFVADNTRMEDGVVMVQPRFGSIRRLSEDWSLYYVHPRTGLLRKNDKFEDFRTRQRKAWAKEVAELAQRMRVVGPDTQAHLIDGVWWEVKLATIPRSGIYTDVVSSAKLSSLPPEKLYGQRGLHATEKRQFSKAELKRLKLR
jgi:hypothetical protein